MVNISRKDLERLAIGFGVADFLTEGRLSAPVARGTKAALRKAAPAIGRAILQYGPAAVGTAARVTPTGAVVSTAALLAIQNREKVAELAAQGYQVVAPAAQQYAAGVAERAMDPQSFMLPEGPTQAEQLGFRLPSSKPRRKIASKFNQAVKKGMAIVKGSTSYGKKGTINNAKKAFSAVTKAASAVSKGRKAPARGIGRKLHTAISKILPKKKKPTKKKSKINITVYKK
jgi:hypothetical protein